MRGAELEDAGVGTHDDTFPLRHDPVYVLDREQAAPPVHEAERERRRLVRRAEPGLLREDVGEAVDAVMGNPERDDVDPAAPEALSRLGDPVDADEIRPVLAPVGRGLTPGYSPTASPSLRASAASFAR